MREAVEQEGEAMTGMICDDCEASTKVLINCEGCPNMVCQSCYDHHHAGHTRKGEIKV